MNWDESAISDGFRDVELLTDWWKSIDRHQLTNRAQNRHVSIGGRKYKVEDISFSIAANGKPVQAGFNLFPGGRLFVPFVSTTLPVCFTHW